MRRTHWQGNGIRVLAGLVLGWVCLGCSPSPEAPAASAAPLPFENISREVAYTGDAVCASCHEDLYRSYQTHGMARSFAEVTPALVPGAFDGAVRYHEATDFYYRLFEEDGRFFQEEYRLDESGRQTHRLVREMRYVVGSGNAAHTYLAERNGRLYELPLTWYTQSRKWGFSPGYEANNKRFDRVLNDRCAFCHASYPASVAFVEGKYAAPPAPIGCERCHGPGALHADARLETPEPPGSIDYTIVNPAHLPMELRLDVCQQCHLSATTVLLRDGRTHYDFRPGEPLADHVALFDARQDETGLIGVNAHANRMQRSACFIETRTAARPMDCVTCHDPHEGFREKGPGYFNATCIDCHALPALQARLPDGAPPHDAAANCFACHMPKTGLQEGPHTAFTDHWIRVVKDAPPPQAVPRASEEGAELLPQFTRDREGPDAPLYQAMAYLSYGRLHGDLDALRTGIRLAERHEKAAAGFADLNVLMGQAWLLLDRPERALPYFEQAVAQDSENPLRLHALAQGLRVAGEDPEQAEQLFRKALAIQPALAEVRAEYGDFLAAQGRPAEAMEAYQAALREAPWQAGAHHGVGFLMLRQGSYTQAEVAFRQALTLEPDYADAHVNLGIVLAATGRRAEALQHYERALALAPAHVAALYNLGTFYLQGGEMARGIALLEEAVATAPQHLNAQLNLALAYLRTGQREAARQAARAVLKLDPEHVQARQILTALDQR